MMQILNREQIEILAEAAHNVWMAGKVAEGYKYAEKTNKQNKEHSCLISYSELSETDKESDRVLVRGIPNILNEAGFTIVTKIWYETQKI